MVRRHKRAIERSKTGIARERQKLANDEKKIMAEIKQLAKKGQMPALRTCAKNLVRNRQQQNKMLMIETNLSAVSLKITTTASTMSMAEAMAGVTKAMASMNKQMNLPNLQKIMAKFEQESEIMDMKQEMMDDAMDDAMDTGETEGEIDNEVNKVLNEMGLATMEQLAAAGGVPSATPQMAPAAAAPAGPVAVGAGSATVDEDDLMARLNNLKDK